MLYQLRLREFAHLQRLGLDYYEREMAGRIMTRMTTDVDALSSFLQTGLVTSVVSLATFVGIAVVLVVMDAGLALIAFLALPFGRGRHGDLPAVLHPGVHRRPGEGQHRQRRPAGERRRAAGLPGARPAAGATPTVSPPAATTTAAPGCGRRPRSRSTSRSSRCCPSWPRPPCSVPGCSRVIAGTMTVGTLIAFVLYLDSFFTPIQQLSQVFDSYQQAQVGLVRIGELLDTPTSTPAADDPLPVPALAGRHRRRSASGSGYSTADAGAGARPGRGRPADRRRADRRGRRRHRGGQVDAGQADRPVLRRRPRVSITVDGTDIRRFDLGAYRRRLGVVPQEPHLFIGTVRDNIAYGRPDATDAEVEAAARAVGALDAIAGLPGGFRHPIAERGRNLSAGQRQLISLARAELVDPDILLLDEATAALDPAAEAAVLAATDRLARGRTTVVVAHRLTTAARADRIVVMDHGRVAETGRHDELLPRGGAYARLYAEAGPASGTPTAGRRSAVSRSQTIAHRPQRARRRVRVSTVDSG